MCSPAATFPGTPSTTACTRCARRGIDTTFWFSFAGFELPHRADPRTGLDLGSYGIVKMLEPKTTDGDSARACPGMPWEPKEAFYTLAEFYSGTARP